MEPIRKYYPPNFSEEQLKNAPDCKFIPSEKDGVLPDNYHSTSIFPEYYKVKGEWLLAKESRMDCQAVLENNEIKIIEMRKIKKGDLVAVGRTERGEEGILVYPFGFKEDEKKIQIYLYLDKIHQKKHLNQKDMMIYISNYNMKKIMVK